MTTISPLLQSKLNNKNSSKGNLSLNNKHEKIYQDLQRRAHEAKPNEAKAVLVDEGMLGNPITAVKDMAKDAKNFFTAAKTGKMGDNNLGRINDLGLKIGAALIATGLALHSKTKTDSIMRFIGGASFIGAMSLWPKLFINIPARLVHGFRIDRKYISAQGDKKDFFLDNQFLVWDAYPEAQLRKDAQNAGIDYDSENGKEKIQRKMQKTALQNRALWMATAGFATPLMTAMFGNFITPKVEKAVVKNGVEKTRKILDMDDFLAQKPKKSLFKFAKNIEAKSDAISALFENYKGKKLDDSFYNQLGELLNPTTYLQDYKDIDNSTPFKEWKVQHLQEELKKVQEQLRIFDKEDLKAKLSQLQIASNGNVQDGLMIFEATTLDKNKVEELINALGDKKATQKEVVEILDALGVEGSARKEILEQTKVDNSAFFKFIRNLKDKIVTPLETRSKAYLDLVNPVIGSKTESAYTLEYNKTLGKLLKTLGLDDFKSLNRLRGAHTDNVQEYAETVTGMISAKIRELSKGTDEEYKAFLQKLSAEPIEGGINKLVERLLNEGNIEQIMPDVEEINGVNIKGIKNALIGASDNDKGLFRLLANFISTKQIDLDAVKSKAVICANLERRILNGDLKDLSEAQIRHLRKIVYDGTISTAANRGHIINEKEYLELACKFFNPEQFKSEMDTLGENFKKALESVSKIFNNPSGFNAGDAFKHASKNYMACGSFDQHMQSAATALSNNKAWARIYAPMTVALIAVTLLVQPLFGKIDKEFPEENGGAR